MKEPRIAGQHRAEHQHHEYATWVGSHPGSIEEAEIAEGKRSHQVMGRPLLRKRVWRRVPKLVLPLPVFGLAVATRAMLGAGIALLLADQLDRRRRRAIGWTLAAIGGLTTLPLALAVFSSKRPRRR